MVISILFSPILRWDRI